MKSQLKDHPQRSSFLSQTETQSPTGFSITSNGNSSPSEFIGGILSRSSLPHIAISSSVYSPTELSYPAGLFSQSSLFAIPSRNEECNSSLQQLSGIYFPQLKTLHYHTSWHMHMCIIQHNLIYFENIIVWYISCITYDKPLLFRKDAVRFSKKIKSYEAFTKVEVLTGS